MMEFYLNIQSDSGLLDDTSALRQWSTAYLSSLEQSGTTQGKKDRGAPGRLGHMMWTAGFVDVRSDRKILHMSPWSASKTT